MSLEIHATIICDSCGQRRLGEAAHAIGRAQSCVWGVKAKAEMDGWQTVSRGRYHTDAHYCPACLDKPIKPIPRAKPRFPRVKCPDCGSLIGSKAGRIWPHAGAFEGGVASPCPGSGKHATAP